MLFFKPSWVTHEDNKPIFSVDIHPKGGRFVTGGQGGSGGRIVVWNLAPVLTEKDENNPNTHRMLCQMDNHLACVNVVRWSNEGHLLASGGDDKLVMIWRLAEGSSSVFGSNTVNVETWKCTHILSLHVGDILDLAWAPHDGWLASGSVDNTVIIWNALKFPEKVAILKGHSGMVKGVAWDPVGKYIASQSDDKSLRIWRTNDWVQQEVVKDPFMDCSATTHVLRLSWSPDGQYLVSAHAMNGGGPTAQIIEREGWRQDKDFVGHRKAVTCVRFNSNILKKVTPGSPKSQQYCCSAIGSRDRSISVWLTSLKRPLVVIKDLFDDSVLDLSWSSNGLYLFACSWDGSVACILFSQEEIGVPLSMKEKNDLYEKIYHKSLQTSWKLSLSGTHIIENPALLKAMEENEKTKAYSSDSTSANTFEIPKPLTTIIESPKACPSVLVPATKQLETRLPSGKRRITPMLLTPVSSTAADITLPISVDTIKLEGGTKASTSFSKSSPSKSKIVVETVSEQRSQPSTSHYIPIGESKEPKRAKIRPPPGCNVSEFMCTEVPGDLPVKQTVKVLDPLELPPGSVVSKTFGDLKIEIKNEAHILSKGTLARIIVYQEKDPKWDTFLGSQIRCITANDKLIVACCEDSSINCYEVGSGARTALPIIIDDVVSCLTLSPTNHCLVLTKTGLMYMWDMDKSKCILCRISVRSLLTKKGSVCSCTLTSQNLPVVTLTDGRVYTYVEDLQTWALLSNPLDPLCHIGGIYTKKVPGMPNLPLASLQTKIVPLHGMNDNIPSSAKLSFFENQMSASLMLKSCVEYRYWLFTVVNHLLDSGPECRLRTILNDLLGPVHNSRKKQRPEDEILGYNKLKLLREVLDVIKLQVQWQRLYSEYNDQLDFLLEDRNSEQPL